MCNYAYSTIFFFFFFLSVFAVESTYDLCNPYLITLHAGASFRVSVYSIYSLRHVLVKRKIVQGCGGESSHLKFIVLHSIGLIKHGVEYKWSLRK